ncbi:MULTISPECIES: hypothetical protein [unclassified Mesorhizobium]|uniref:hypothetical protein n=1 Tax=unclassified Mesorhizobium TaxID=325217 RepID=UPI000BAF5A5E|nr:MULTISPECIES: hypothetical protein [unclassified Mesorhizobium]PBC23472.1 hypothetical protein CK226_10115 [Mesorhizobium sp. WSM4311]TRD06838.1 hypothetical protein FJV82_08910 [Mesorhizobium sp. WSM4305]
MPIKVSPVAGSRFYIGSAPVDVPDVDVVEGDFAAVTWIEVGQYETMGNSGDAAQGNTVNLLNRRRTYNWKGSRQAPQRSDNFALNTADPGQLAMIAAEQTDYNYPFKVELNGAPTPKSAAATITIASPGVVTFTGHGLAANTAVKFSTTGALPTGLTAGTTYYVKTVLDADTFTLATSKGGTAIVTTGSQSGVHTATTVPAGPQRLFMGQVAGAEEGMGGANNAQMLNCTVLPNTNYVRVAALG